MASIAARRPRLHGGCGFLVGGADPAAAGLQTAKFSGLFGPWRTCRFSVCAPTPSFDAVTL